MMTTIRWTAVTVALVFMACGDDNLGAPHPTDELDYPVSVTADPSGRLVWVVSGNFDLAWRGAAIIPIDVLENRFVEELAFEVGNFPGPLTLLEDAGRAIAGYVTSRDEDSVYFVRFGGDDPARPAISCPDGVTKTGSILHCPESGAIHDAEVEADGEPFTLTVGRDPFSSVVRKARLGGEPDLLFVGGMRDGVLATLALAADGTPHLVGNVRLNNGLFGLSASQSTGRIYTSSKVSSAFNVLEIKAREDSDDPDRLDPINPYVQLLGTVRVSEPAVVTDRARDVALSRDGTRMYASYRAPDSLFVLDVADHPDGSPRARVVQRVPLSADPGDIEVVTTESGEELIYVSCYRANRVEVVDPRSGSVIASIKTGQSPSGLAVVDRPDLGVQRLYVALFNDHAVGVIELDPSSPFYHTEIGEIR